MNAIEGIRLVRRLFTDLEAAQCLPEGLSDAFFVRLGATLEGGAARRPILASLLRRERLSAESVSP